MFVFDPHYSFLGNSLWQWLSAIAVCMALFLVGALARRLIRRYYATLAKTTQIEALEVPVKIAARTNALFLFVVSLYAASSLLTVSDSAQKVLKNITIIIAFWQLGIWIAAAAIAWVDHKRKLSAAVDRATEGSLTIISVVLRAIIWILVLLLALDNLGVNITTLVASLGIGGVAIALAVQNILGDLLASLSITMDKPFVLGDFVVVGDFMGSIEYIGIKSTRLRSLSGEQIVMANSDLLASRLRNYGRMNDRRVEFLVKVPYGTDAAALRAIPGEFAAIIKSQPKTRLDRCHLAQYGEYSIEFACVYFVLDPDYNLFMDIQQEILLQINAALGRKGIELAMKSAKIYSSEQANARNDDNHLRDSNGVAESPAVRRSAN